MRKPIIIRDVNQKEALNKLYEAIDKSDYKDFSKKCSWINYYDKDTKEYVAEFYPYIKSHKIRE